MSNDLRTRARKRLDEKSPSDVVKMPIDDVQALVEELQIHQVELKMQNEELRRAQVELADSRDRYLDLYELAPVGYLTLDEHRTVREANLTICRLLGIERDDLLGQRIDGLAVQAYRDDCFRHFRDVLTARIEKSFEIQLARPDKSSLWTLAKCVPNQPDMVWPGGCRVTITDISDRKLAEDSLSELNRDLERRVDNRTAELQTLGSHLLNAQEKERQRIAAGLHDEIGQLLAAAQLKLAEAQDCQDANERNDLLTVADRILNDASNEIRGLTFELSSTALFDRGMLAAAKELCNHMKERYGIRCKVDCPRKDIAVPKPVRPCLYHCLRELLYNVVKHAGVDSATVRMETPTIDRALLRITVRDYGNGFDTRDLNRPLTRNGGFGLRHVQERMRDLGGALLIESVPGDGTRAVLEVRIAD